ncbi:hypothetical protein [Fusobacterium sp. MFO224]|uniref:hypothetical protein n=1 Tax=Fusobacterium sp. MFO224 TaxID=3378070 RepID=UPI0038538833
MSKANKELAVGVALKVIESNQTNKFLEDTNNGSKIICDVIEKVYKKLEELDEDTNTDMDIEALDIP